MKSTRRESWVLRMEIESWPNIVPFRITGQTFYSADVLLVSVERQGQVGRGEAAGVFYKHETPASMRDQIELLREDIQAGISRETLQEWLPCGGARNALDCALWDLESKLSGRPVWQIAEVPKPRPLLTTFTCGADEPDKMAAAALAYKGARAIKVKLTGEPADVERIRAVRQARPEVWLSVDANQGFSRQGLEELMPTLVLADVKLIEQPFAVGQEALLDGFESPIPIAADESVQGVSDIPTLVGRFNVVNIKLDKCGGLTEGLKMARAAQAHGLAPMVGNTGGTSLAMAPGFVLGQLCSFVDLDGPVFLQKDRHVSVQYEDGFIRCPTALWGD
jgi:L-alanine-DL-glutamate epimerase-like enolase superfamily enzyme